MISLNKFVHLDVPNYRNKKLRNMMIFYAQRTKDLPPRPVPTVKRCPARENNWWDVASLHTNENIMLMTSPDQDGKEVRHYFSGSDTNQPFGHLRIEL